MRWTEDLVSGKEAQLDIRLFQFVQPMVRGLCRSYTELRFMAAQIIPAQLTSDDFLEFYSEQEEGLRRFELWMERWSNARWRTEFTMK
jgi:hypothetical protein